MSLIDYYPLKNGRRATWLVVACAILAAGAVAWAVVTHWPWGGPGLGKFNYVAIQPGTLEIVIRQEGELQAINNIDISCPVEGQNTIQQIVPEGTFVKKGEVIAVLDPTEHMRRLETAQIELEKADADVKWAKEQKAIQEVKNAADLEAANSELALARLDLREYTDGQYPADLRAAQRKLEMADITLKKKEEELATSRRLLDRGYMTLSEVQKSQLEVVTARNEQEKAASELLVLTEYKHAKDSAEKQDKVTQADNKVARVQNENASNLNQKISDLRTKERQLELRKTAFDRATKMHESCTIKAPADGMVLYASSVAQIYYYRDQPIQAGSKVMQEMLMVRLPDTSKMKAVVKIPESRVSRLRMQVGEGDSSGPLMRAEVKIVGLPKPIGATLSKIGVLPDNSQRYINPDAKDYPVDLALDETPSNLKPGASANVTIHDGRLENVLAVPIGAIYASGQDSYVFLRDNPHPRPTKVTIGESNETMVQVTDGLEPGQHVLMLEAGQGRDLLDLAGIKPAPAPTAAPTSQPALPPTLQPAPPAVPQTAQATPPVG